VADQQARRFELLAQEAGGRDQVLHVRRKIRVREISLAGAEPGEIEAQHRHVTLGQALRDAVRRQYVLAAGETVGKHTVGARCTVRHLELGRNLAVRPLELNAFCRHAFFLLR